MLADIKEPHLDFFGGLNSLSHSSAETSSKTPRLEAWSSRPRLRNLCILSNFISMSSSLLTWILFKFLAFFGRVLVVFLPTNATNKINLWIIEIFINYLFAIYKVSRPETFQTNTETETKSQNSITVVWYHWFCKFINSFVEIIFSIFQVSTDRERCLTASVREFILCGILLAKVSFL